jgi:tRNA U34 2-thiouridine synthase MnmA/TrmU
MMIERTGRRRVRAISVFSGGLDSTLAVKVIQKQEVEVLALTFRSAFFGPAAAEASARQLGIPLRIIDFTAEHLELVRSPPHGYGRNMNPCIDCHAMMFRHAGAIMEKEGYDFLFTGEVLGERPMSQNRGALQLVAREAGYPDRILRPLSAQLLPATKPEREGLIDRELLLDIRGRSRKPQMELARKFGVTDYPTPAGGCKLTDPNFSARLRDLFEHVQDVTVRDVEFLRLGRHFRLSEDVKLVVGRNQEENRDLMALARPSDVHLIVAGPPGPDVLILSEQAPREEHVELAARITASYSDADDHRAVTVKVTTDEQRRELSVLPLPREDARKLLI